MLRSAYAEMSIIGIEPALKPAAAASKTGVVGVMATRGTLGSEKFCKLLASLSGTARFVLQPCDGLADAIERADAPRTLALCQQYTVAMGAFGAGPGEMDTVVLGCTHYPFASQTCKAFCASLCIAGRWPTRGPADPAFAGAASCCFPLCGFPLFEYRHSRPAQTLYYSTGAPGLLDAAVQRWLQLRIQTAPLLV